jgi:hypothetical protein
MNERLSQLKKSAENVTVNTPEQFAEIFARLMYNDVMSVIQDLKKNPDTTAVATAEGDMSWMMAIATIEIKLKEYFGVK